jgi:23S rRNA (cytosine1962-C5)-methyltransferase
MGLFPEQAVNWAWLRELISQEKSPKILNLFAYTGGATVACLNAGADVTHIDAAKGMNNWARDNISLNALQNKKHRVLTDDVLKFVQREARRGNMYDGIIMDPPVFGRGPGGEMWKLEERLYELVENCTKLLSETPLFFLINAYTAGFSPTAYGNILNVALKKFGGEVTVGEIGLSAKSGILLPCGMYARWVTN